MEQTRISVFIPTYNEEKKISSSLRSIPDFIDEIIIYDKGSKDKTVEIARNFKKPLCPR